MYIAHIVTRTFVPAEENLVFNERSVKMIKGSINITVKMKLLTLEVACY